jgi:hypothetical protein
MISSLGIIFDKPTKGRDCRSQYVKLKKNSGLIQAAES